MLKKLLLSILSLSILSLPLLSYAPAAYAEGEEEQTGSCTYLLGMPSWNCGVNYENVDSEGDLSEAIWMIVANIATSISVIATYLAIAYVLYGGYKYIFANGNATKVAGGKNTLNRAFIGLAIAMSASVILNTIRVVLIQNGKFTDCDLATSTGNCINAAGVSDMVVNIINWVIGVSGTVALAFVIGGGIQYITSNGEPDKLRLAKSTIKYALIGLVIVALAETIVIFMTHIINSN